MMQFNSPKNFKRGRLINNRYRPIDLMVASVTITITMATELLYLLFLNGTHIAVVIALCIPAMIGVCLLIPFEIYHNPIEMIKLYFIYRNRNKVWIWEGIYKHDSIVEEGEMPNG